MEKAVLDFNAFSFERCWRKKPERSISVHQSGQEANTTLVIPGQNPRRD